ncbi:MAG: exo-alpha-sialidase [Candidatus Hydrogenedentes bacterium]|nr:exo-alpha-sialidase [Candidatus Hydrogenedentota bacterium]
MRPIINALLMFSLLVIMGLKANAADESPTVNVVPYAVELSTIMEYKGGDYLWFHPRVSPLPGQGKDGQSAAIMTFQKHLFLSDYYSGLSYKTTYDGGKTWSAINTPAELAWVDAGKGIKVSPADMTPGWHAATETVLNVGAEVRYSSEGKQLADIKRAHQTTYSVYDPKTEMWSKLKRVEMPLDDKFDVARSACAQWVALDDGTVLLPFYYATSQEVPHSVTVAQFSFDGKDLTYLRHGNEMDLDVVRGLVEPSLIKFQDTFYLTIRNDERAYVTSSKDGLNFAPFKPWTFEDGEDLGSYNTQQHWAVSPAGGLFLCYTRRGANNDHLFRHRAPLFIAQVNPHTLQVIRKTEKVLVPERGATLGNFGVVRVGGETWVTVSEGIFTDAARASQATGATFLARIIWGQL